MSTAEERYRAHPVPKYSPEVLQLIKDTIVAGPGDTVILLAHADWTPKQVSLYQQQLHEITTNLGMSFTFLVVAASGAVKLAKERDPDQTRREIEGLRPIAASMGVTAEELHARLTTESEAEE